MKSKGLHPRQTYRPERPKGAKDEVKRIASEADYSRPRQTIAEQSILISAVLPASPPLFQNVKPIGKMRSFEQQTFH